MWLIVLVKQDRGHFRTPPFIQLSVRWVLTSPGRLTADRNLRFPYWAECFITSNTETGEGERSETWLRASQTQDAPSTLSGTHTAIASQAVKDFG